jgi:hypothetical protein
MQDQLSKLLQDALVLLLTGLVGILIPFALNWVKLKLANLNQAQLDLMQQAVAMFVSAAETLGVADRIEDKKEWVLGEIQVYLNSKGIKLDVQLIDAAIEAEVFNQFNRYKPAQVSVTDTPTTLKAK